MCLHKMAGNTVHQIARQAYFLKQSHQVLWFLWFGWLLIENIVGQSFHHPGQ